MSDKMSRVFGFCGTDVETYYISPSGRAWIIQSEDDLGTDDPVEILASDIPDSATMVDGLMTPREAILQLRRIEAVSGEKLIDG